MSPVAREVARCIAMAFIALGRRDAVVVPDATGQGGAAILDGKTVLAVIGDDGQVWLDVSLDALATRAA